MLASPESVFLAFFSLNFTFFQSIGRFMTVFLAFVFGVFGVFGDAARSSSPAGTKPPTVSIALDKSVFLAFFLLTFTFFGDGTSRVSSLRVGTRISIGRLMTAFVAFDFGVFGPRSDATRFNAPKTASSLLIEMKRNAKKLTKTLSEF